MILLEDAKDGLFFKHCSNAYWRLSVFYTRNSRSVHERALSHNSPRWVIMDKLKTHENMYHGQLVRRN